MGAESDWLRNVLAGGAAEVIAGRRSFVPEIRVMESAEGGAIIQRYRARRPHWSALSERMVGRPLSVATVTVVGLRLAPFDDK